MDFLLMVQIEFVVLLVGTVYAWYNWYLVLVGKCDTCSVGVHEKPFSSKCFWGALFFTLALFISIGILSLV